MKTTKNRLLIIVCLLVGSALITGLFIMKYKNAQGKVFLEVSGFSVEIKNMFNLKTLTFPQWPQSVSFSTSALSCWDDGKVLNIDILKNNDVRFVATPEEYEKSLYVVAQKVVFVPVTINGDSFYRFDGETTWYCNSPSCPRSTRTAYVKFFKDRMLEIEPSYNSCGGKTLGKEKIDIKIQ